jgi:hypothetical protein
LNCPYCGTTRVAFELFSESWVSRSQRWHVCARCNYCAGLAVLEFKAGPDEDEKPSKYYSWASERYIIESVFPAPGGEFPAHLPEEVAKFFKQGADNTPANPDAAGTMFRKALEAMLRDKYPGAKGRLLERIDQAAKAGVLTTELARYAHTIRLEGNEAAHGDYEEADADRLRSFTTLVLQYVYTLPGMQAQIDAEASAAASGK